MNKQHIDYLRGGSTELVLADVDGKLSKSPVGSIPGLTLDNIGGTLSISKGGTGATTRVGILGMLFPLRVVTAAGNVTIVSTDYTVGIRKTVPANTQVDLPAGYASARFEISDFADNADLFPLTIVPNGTETIMGEADMLMDVKGGSITLVFDVANNDRRII